MKISIIVANFNKAFCLRDFLNSVFSNSYNDFELIVVDDASTDESVSILKEYDLKLIQNSRNLGPATSRNIAAKMASGEILVFCDSDIIIDKNALELIVKRFSQFNLDSLTAKMIMPPVTDNLIGNYWTLDFIETCERAKLESGLYKCWSSTLGAISKKKFMEIGGFDEYYKGADIEDHELSFRLSKNSKMYYDSEICFRHNFESSSIAIKKAFKRTFQLAQLDYRLDENPGFNWHRRVGYILSIFNFIAVLISVKIFIIISLIRIIHHRTLFLKIKSPILFIYSFFMGILISLSAVLGFGTGKISRIINGKKVVKHSPKTMV